jgi:hypothetical protein
LEFTALTTFEPTLLAAVLTFGWIMTITPIPNSITAEAIATHSSVANPSSPRRKHSARWRIRSIRIGGPVVADVEESSRSNYEPPGPTCNGFSSPT